jgi:hypothetical protein
MATLPRPTRNWTIAPNAVSFAALGTPGATNQRVMRLLVVAGVTAGAWTVDYSCDALVAGVKGDLVNRWDADGDIVNNSWMVVTLQGGLGQILMHRDGATDGAGSVFWSETVGFTGGTTGARPTAADELEITHTANWLSTTNGNHAVHLWVSTEAGEQGVRIAVVNSGVAAGPVALVSLEMAATQLGAWTNPVIARWMAGAGAFGNRGDWTASGWQSRVSGTARLLTLDGLAPQVATDPDGDRLAEPSGVTNATIGDIGWADDFFTVDDGVTNLATFSDPDGTRGWVVFDEIVWPWDHVTDLGVANIAGAKLRQNYLPGDAECELTGTVPTVGAPLGNDFEDGRWRAITLFFTIPDGFVPTARVIMDGHAIWHVAFDGAAWSPLFDPARTPSAVNISGNNVTLTLLPIGGWWGAPDIKVGAFLEAT